MNTQPPSGSASSPPPSQYSLDLSIVIPLFNEQESIMPLYDGLTAVLRGLNRSFEIIFINDGSADDSYGTLCRLAEKDGRVKVINLRRNFGQTAAMVAGFDHSQGSIIIPMDGDLQNDPVDIPLLIAKLEEGYDIASGWRKDRQDKEGIRRSEEHTSELQSRQYLVCRLLLEKKK